MTRLDAIRARLQAATAGPWKAADQGSHHRIYPPKSLVASRIADVHRGFRNADGVDEISVNECAANADLIAHAPDDLAWLLALVDDLAEAAERDHIAGAYPECGGCAALARLEEDE